MTAPYGPFEHPLKHLGDGVCAGTRPGPGARLRFRLRGQGPRETWENHYERNRAGAGPPARSEAKTGPPPGRWPKLLRKLRIVTKTITKPWFHQKM